LGAAPKTVTTYLEELRKSREGKPDPLREAIDAYVALWERALERHVVEPSDDRGSALAKVDGAGGLYEAGEASDVQT